MSRSIADFARTFQELTTGVLPLVLIKMAVMDRDERGDHRIPILMNYLSESYPFVWRRRELLLTTFHSQKSFELPIPFTLSTTDTQSSESSSNMETEPSNGSSTAS